VEVTTGAEPRLAPLPREQWDADVEGALRGAFAPGVAERFLSTGSDAIPVPEAITTMLHNPELARTWLTFNNVLLWNPLLEGRQRELMVLRVAWRTRSNYEWLQHVALAPRFDITSSEIEAVAAGTYGEFKLLDQALLDATDQLVDDYRVDDATWAVLAEHLDAAQLVEVVFVVGAYTCLAMAFKSFGLQLEPPAGASATALPDS
jgi:alkylhydroperoxidase family enzyme